MILKYLFLSLGCVHTIYLKRQPSAAFTASRWLQEQAFFFVHPPLCKIAALSMVSFRFYNQKVLGVSGLPVDKCLDVRRLLWLYVKILNHRKAHNTKDKVAEIKR